jgi:hypothetical protein
MNEREQAFKIANNWLDNNMDALVEMVPGDPDCDACVLARQFIRLSDRIEALEDALRKIAEWPPSSRIDDIIGAFIDAKLFARAAIDKDEGLPFKGPRGRSRMGNHLMTGEFGPAPMFEEDAEKVEPVADEAPASARIEALREMADLVDIESRRTINHCYSIARAALDKDAGK